MADYSELKRNAQEIRDEVKIGGNTAYRVGTELVGIVNELQKLSESGPIVINGDVTNAPDEEDITSTKNNLLKLKDRNSLNGMGYVILRKGKSFAEQVTKANTIYEIRYDFDLEGKEVTIPEGCVLDFQGGSLSNGTIIGNNTGINASLVKIFNLDVTIRGTWSIKEAYPEWFGSRGNAESDDRDFLQKVIDSPFPSVKLQGKYLIASTVDGVGINIPTGRIIRGESHSIWSAYSSIQASEGLLCDALIQLGGYYITLENIAIIGNESYSCKTLIKTRESDWSPYLNISHVHARYASESIFDISTFVCRITECVVEGSKGIGFNIRGSSSRGTTTTISNCYAMDTDSYGFSVSKMSYSSLNNCAADRCGVTMGVNSYYWYDCNNVSMISCGCEAAISGVGVNYCYGITIDSCAFAATYDSKPIGEFIICRGASISNCRFGIGIKDINSKLVHFNYQCLSCLFSNAFFEDGSGKRNMLKWDNVNCECPNELLFIRPSLTKNTDVEYNIKDIIQEKLNNNISSLPIVITSTRTFYFNFKLENINTRITITDNGTFSNYISSPLEIHNCSHIIFKGLNIEFSYTDYSSLFGKFVNSIVEFVNCSIIIRNGLEVSNLFTLIDSKLMLTDCTISNPMNIPIISPESEGSLVYVTRGTDTQISKDGSFHLRSGEYWQLPHNPPIGFQFFCTSKRDNFSDGYGVVIFYKGEGVWVDSQGRVVGTDYPIANRGSNYARPNLSDVHYGFVYYDSTLGKPIWWSGSKWVDAAGAEV